MTLAQRSHELIPDIMHDVVEGALPLEVKLMLKAPLRRRNSLDTQLIAHVAWIKLIPHIQQ